MNDLELSNQSIALIEESKKLLIIKSQDDFNVASEYLQRNKAQQKRIEEFFEKTIKLLHEAHANECSKKKAALIGLVENYKAVSKANSAYLVEQDQKRRKEEARLQEEARLKAEAERAAIIAESAKAEAEGDITAASDYLDQINDIQEKPVTSAPQLIKTVKTTAGSSSYQADIEVGFDRSQLLDLLAALYSEQLPAECLECIDVKTGPLKAYFKKKGISEFNHFGIIVKPTFRPSQRV